MSSFISTVPLEISSYFKSLQSNDNELVKAECNICATKLFSNIEYSITNCYNHLQRLHPDSVYNLEDGNLKFTPLNQCKAKKNRSENNELYSSFTLYGDSYLVRYEKQLLKKEKTGYNEIDFAKSGRKSANLLEHIRRSRGNSLLKQNALIMIGINDINKGKDHQAFGNNIRKIANILRHSTTKAIWLTLPTPQIWENNLDKIKMLNKYNRKICTLPKHHPYIKVIDIREIFLKNDKVNTHLFEQFYIKNCKKDQLHWNLKGMLKVHEEIKQS